jgi:hypothetical protein
MSPIRPRSRFASNYSAVASFPRIDGDEPGKDRRWGFEEQVIRERVRIFASAPHHTLILESGSVERPRCLRCCDTLSSEFNRWRTVDGLDWLPGDRLPENNLWATR